MKNIFLCFVLLSASWSFTQNLIMNGDMEAGAGGTGVVPTNWSIVQHTPDNCASPPSPCPGPSYVINNPSPDGGKWVRFFRGGGWNERFGQYICQPLIAGETYTLQFWASHSDLNSSANATNTGIDFGFSNGLPGGTGAGAGNASSVALTTPETWQLVTHTFVATANYDFLSFAKNTTDTQNATYIDGVSLIGANPSAPVLPADTVLCTGQTLLLDVSGITGPYLWQDGSTAGTYNVTTAGTYYVDIGAAGGCQNTDTIVVTYSPGATVDLGPDISLCTGQTATLDASAAPAPYLWSDGSTAATLVVNSSGQYFVDVGSGACSGSDTVNVTVGPPPALNLGPDQTLCTGQSVVLDASSVAGPYVWQDGSTNATLTATTTGQYYVDAGSGSCISTDTVNLTFGAPPALDMGPDQTICPGDVTVLDASSVTGPYLWSDGSTAANLNVTAAGTYFVEAGTAPCLSYDTVVVSIGTGPVFNLGNDTTLCTGQNLLLDVSAIPGPYLWQDASTNGTFNVTTTGQYYVQIGTGGCSSSDTINVNFNPPAAFSLGNDTTICAGDQVVIDMSALSGPYFWQDGSTNPTFTIQNSGLYWLENGTSPCTFRDSINITVEQYPVVNLGSDVTLCQGDNVVLDASSSGGPYVWQDGSAGSSLTADASGIYWVEVGTNCRTRDSIEVSMVNVTVDFTVDDPDNCGPYSPIFTSNAVTNGGGVNNWNWSFGDGQSSTSQNPSHYYNNEGSYDVSLSVETIEGCTADVTYPNLINVYGFPQAMFSASPTNPTTENTTVAFTDVSIDAIQWNWNFGNNQGGSNEQNPVYDYPSTPGDYNVELIVTNSYGCQDTNDLTITISEQLIFYVPNVFTPDGDAFNETFSPVFTAGMDPYDFHLIIFNRWGEVIFESYNKDIGWDGTYGDGGLVQDGTYIWQVDFKETVSDKRHEYRGHVTVLK